MVIPGIPRPSSQWIGLKEHLQETIDFPMKFMGLSGFNFPLNQSIDHPNKNISVVNAEPRRIDILGISVSFCELQSPGTFWWVVYLRM
jgi:hypothetical protein